MGSNLLKKAKRYQKTKKWQEAIELFEKYMNENNDQCDAKTYIDYAKCLRVLGHTDEAKKILIKGEDHHPEDEGILRAFHNFYDFIGDWKSAETTAKKLIKIKPEQANYYFRLGRTYAFLSEYKKAKEVYKVGLKYKHGMNFEELKEKIQRGFAENPKEVSSEYIFIDGRNNLGAFIHEYQGQRYFTKISRSRRSSLREEIFYKDVCSDFPMLNQMVPMYIDSQTIDGVIYLTSKQIDGVSVTSDDTKNVIDTSMKITSIKYDDIIGKYPNPEYLFQLRNRPISIILLFTQIHQEYYNDRLFTSLHRLAKQKKYPEMAIEVIKKMESLVMENHLYMFIKPEKHYSLLHGDFIPGNLKVKKENDNVHVFDWATFTIGPHFIDIARYLTTTFTPYSQAKKLYLSDNQTGGKLTLIEKIFFLYASILFYFLTLKGKKMEERLSDFILPALNDMEMLVAEFKKEGYNDAVQALVEEREEKEKNRERINQLKKRVRRLEKRNKKIQKRHQDMLASKSWKITAPLRKVIQWKSKDK